MTSLAQYLAERLPIREYPMNVIKKFVEKYIQELEQARDSTEQFNSDYQRGFNTAVIHLRGEDLEK